MKDIYNGNFALGFITGAGVSVVTLIFLEWFGVKVIVNNGLLLALGAILGGSLTIVVMMMTQLRKEEPGNLYFLTIEFGINKLEEGVTYQSYADHMKQLGFQMTEYYSRMTFIEFYGVKEKENRGNPNGAIKADNLFVLNSESVFRHLEHVELQEARLSSRNAMKMATGSLMLAAIVGGTQIWLAFQQG